MTDNTIHYKLPVRTFNIFQEFGMLNALLQIQIPPF